MARRKGVETMATIGELTTTFLEIPNAQGFPRQFDNSLVTPIVDCDAYNQAINAALGTVGTGGIAAKAANQADKQFILLHNWWLALEGAAYDGGNGITGIELYDDGFYTMDGPERFPNATAPVPPTTGGTDRLLETLKTKSTNGVDVRVMGWIASGITAGDKNARAAATIANVNSATLRSIELLRPVLGMKAITNEIAHTAGACHLKMVIIGNKTNAVGFTGGLDFEIGRWAKPFHEDYFVPGPAGPLRQFQQWHDVVAKVQGPAVAALYEWYSTVWREVIGRSPVTYKLINKTTGTAVTSTIVSHSMERTAAGTPDVDAFPVPSPVPSAGGQRVQSLRTSPEANFALSNNIIPGLKTSQAPSYATQGIQEFQRGIKKAISGASRYIYIEDQALYSRDIMGYIHDRVVANPDVKVILVTGGADPNDQAQPINYLGSAMDALLNGFAGGAPLTTPQKDRVRLYLRLTEFDLGMGTIASVATPSPNIYRLTISPGAIPPLFTQIVTGAVVPPVFNKPKPAGRPFEIDALAGTHRAQVQIASNFFPVVANPQIKAGDPVVFDVQPGAFDIFTLGIPAAGPFQMFIMPGITIHAKTTLIDDQCAIIGSANAMRRSLFTDVEHSVVFVDTGTAVTDYRAALWSDHFRHPTASDFSDIDASLHAWNAAWGTAGAAPRRPRHIIQLPLPLPSTLTPDMQVLLDAVLDVDSRQTWGGITALKRLQAIAGGGGSP